MRCDIVTRETGYLAKQVLLFDMKGSRLSDMMDRRQSGIHKEVSSSSAYLYPQVRPMRGGARGVPRAATVYTLYCGCYSDTCTVCALCTRYVLSPSLSPSPPIFFVHICP